MTSNGTTIALIITQFIASLIAPTFAAWLLAKSRINQPIPTPDPNQPKKRAHRIRGLVIGVFKSPWLIPSLFILLNIYDLLKILRGSGPVTRNMVFGISMGVALILYWILVIVINITWQAISLVAAFQERVVALVQDSATIHRLFCDWLTELSKAVAGASAATQETQDKLRDAIRNIFRD